MKRETLIWTILFVGGSAFLAYRAAWTERGVGQQFVVPKVIEGMVSADSGEVVPFVEGMAVEKTAVRRSVRYDLASKEDDQAVFSPARTIGIWVAALLTLFIFSYLYRDNVCYKLAESIIVGVSAGWAIVMNFWEVLVAKILVKLSPDVARYAFLSDTPLDAAADYVTLIPVVLGCLVFCRLIPKIGWLGRWPLAFVIGTTAGLKMVFFLNADFVRQVRSTILPLVVFTMEESGQVVNWKQSIQNIVIVVSVLSSLTYFYFSVEHKGWVGRVSRTGVWVLMISFGASFALTVMGRITLLTMRLEFLCGDWLGLIN